MLFIPLILQLLLITFYYKYYNLTPVVLAFYCNILLGIISCFCVSVLYMLLIYASNKSILTFISNSNL